MLLTGAFFGCEAVDVGGGGAAAASPKKPSTPPKPEASGVTVSPEEVTLEKGDSRQFTAALAGGSGEEAFTWSVEGIGEDSATAIDEDGLLTIDEDETATEIIVKAVLKSGEAESTETESADTESGETESDDTEDGETESADTEGDDTKWGTAVVTVVSPETPEPPVEPEPGAPGDPGTPAASITLNSVTQQNDSLTTTTTSLKLTFSEAISELTADNISISNESTSSARVSKNGDLTKSGAGYTYYVPVRVDAGGKIIVSVQKDGISPASKEVEVYYAIPISLNITANGGPTSTTTALTLTFSEAITGLTVDNIVIKTINGPEVLTQTRTLNGSGATYTLPITVNAEVMIDVYVRGVAGYDISGTTKNIQVYYAPAAPKTEVILKVAANGTPTTSLTLAFGNPGINELTENDIKLSPSFPNMKLIKGNGMEYTLNLGTVATMTNTINVTVSKDGYIINGSPVDVPVNLKQK
jgi:hypothetical protein